MSINDVFRAAAAAFDRVCPVPAAPVYSGVIGKIDVQLLRVACPERTEAQLAPWVEPIQRACKRFDINTVRRVAAFISQMAHESSLKEGREENLNYSARRLTEVWKSRFPTIARAEPYARNPEKLANRVYAGRMGNGPEISGDGWKFRGAGPMQLTGRSNWTGFADAMGMTVDQALTYGRTLEGGVMSAAWFWNVNDLNRLADTPGVEDETRRINGGTHGLADRTARFNRTVAALLAAGA
ncbi:putative chitinase [Blastomonas natatoria]|uniref:Putative chitinase n=1 Tax=Blastomonas natatoria TaxID=34015 RepID=A0A2V3V2M0_9SPHN|nr:glycoside hydrolase family 19 protein [Blastomonas natatoria]PXW75993.1 putative chitinase [Blastomonas natatoria]